MYLVSFVLTLALSAGLLLAAGCGMEPTREAQGVTFGELFSSPEQYRGRDILLESFFFTAGKPLF